MLVISHLYEVLLLLWATHALTIPALPLYQIDVYCSCINLAHFTNADKDPDESNPNGFILAAKLHGVTVHLSGDDRDSWIGAIREVIKSAKIKKDAVLKKVRWTLSSALCEF